MCTVSWQFNASGYQLFFNRDELNSRQPALSPEIKQHQNTRVIAPTDTDAGGTWISVNEHGLTLCLLNNYAAQEKIKDKAWISRGQLVLDLSHATDADSLLALFNAIEPNHYRPFDLLILALNDHIHQLSWDGSELQLITNPEMPLTSSSFQTEAVINSRVQQFHQITDLTDSQLQHYHASHSPERGAFSVCMHRDNGQTVSFSHISVNQAQVSFDYYDGSPCNAGEAHTTRLEIKSAQQTHVA